MTKPYVIALASLQGGTGRTTLAIELCRQLSTQGYATGLIELDSANLAGIIMNATAPHAREDQRLPAGVTEFDYVAYSNLFPGGQDAFNTREGIDAPATWIRENTNHDLVLIDLPRGPYDHLMGHLALANLVLHVTTPSPLALRHSLWLEARCEHPTKINGAAIQIRHLLNMIDSREPLTRDIIRLLRAQLGDRVLRDMIHRDQALPESQATGTSLTLHAPESQALRDIEGLVQWLVETALQTP